MDIDWDELDAEQTIATVTEQLKQTCDGTALEELAEVLGDTVEGWTDGDTLRTRLEGTRLLVAILSRELDLRDQTGEEITAMDPLTDFAEECRLGPVAEEVAAAMLREHRTSRQQLQRRVHRRYPPRHRPRSRPRRSGRQLPDAPAHLRRPGKPPAR